MRIQPDHCRADTSAGTGRLECLAEGLTARLAAVGERGKKASQRDGLVKEYRLSDCQAKPIAHMLEHGSLTLQDFGD